MYIYICKFVYIYVYMYLCIYIYVYISIYLFHFITAIFKLYLYPPPGLGPDGECLWSFVWCLGGWLDCFKGADPLFSGCPFVHRPPHFSIIFLTSSWDPFFPDFGANLGPTCLPTWLQNPPKIIPRGLQIPSQLASYFRCLFLSILGASWVEF